MGWKLKQKQSLPLEAKIILSQRRIKEWYEFYAGEIDLFFSGGYDSTVLTHLVRSMYPDVPLVFVDTMLEFPEIRAFVKTFDNVVTIKPKMPYKQVIEKYGHPVVSKKVSMGVTRYRNTKSEVQRQLRLHGGINPTSGREQQRTIPIKYHHLVDAPFKISDKCCDIMKKEPAKRRWKETGRAPMTGEMAADSTFRKEAYNRYGCNAFDKGVPKSMPLAVWTKEDVVAYTEMFSLEQCSVYAMGYDRTGCWKCKFGCDMEPSPGRFVIMKTAHPKLWQSIIDDPEEMKVLNYLKIPTGLENPLTKKEGHGTNEHPIKPKTRTSEEENMEPERFECPTCGKYLTKMKNGELRTHACKEKEQVEDPAPPPGKVTMAAVIAKFIETRDEIAARKKALDLALADLTALQEKRGNWLKGQLTTMGTDSAKVEGVGTVFFDWKDSAKVDDPLLFIAWVGENFPGRKHFLENRVSKTAVKADLDEGINLPPGISYTKIKDVKVRRS